MYDQFVLVPICIIVSDAGRILVEISRPIDNAAQTYRLVFPANAQAGFQQRCLCVRNFLDLFTEPPAGLNVESTSELFSCYLSVCDHTISVEVCLQSKLALILHYHN